MPPLVDAEDTIVVKGRISDSNKSTRARIESPKIPSLALVNTSLAHQSYTPQNLESPESDSLDSPGEQLLSFTRTAHDTPPPTDQETPGRIKRQRVYVGTMEERLQAMPEKRALPWRPGVEPGAEVETGGHSRRKQIRFGCLLATRGDVAPAPCNSCANGRGKFNMCIILDGFFKNACASCQLSGRPNKCSIKQSDDGDQSPKAETPGGTGDVHKESRRTSSAAIQSPAVPPAKRRRTKDKELKEVPVPEWENKRPAWEQHELPDSHNTRVLKDTSQNHRSSWAPVNVSTPVTLPQREPVSDNRPRASMGWAAVNQAPAPAPSPAPVSHPLPPPHRTSNSTHIPESNMNGTGTSHNAEYERQRQQHQLQYREEPAPQKPSSPALIDVLPKSKQRQVYGLVSGLQGGIEHLQRELDALKKALGIDEEI